MLLTCSLALTCLCFLATFLENPMSSIDELIRQAKAAYQANRFTQSAALYTQALPRVQESERADLEFSLACAQALSGDRTGAFKSLDLSVEDGLIDRKSTESAKDLDSLHGDPRWRALIERMTLITSQQEARWGDSAFATPNTSNLSDADKLAGLSELWAQAQFGLQISGTCRS